VADDASVDALAAWLAEGHGRLDVLVNNAAIHYDIWQRGVDADLAVVHEALETNLMGAWRTARACLPRTYSAGRSCTRGVHPGTPLPGSRNAASAPGGRRSRPPAARPRAWHGTAPGGGRDPWAHGPQRSSAAQLGVTPPTRWRRDPAHHVVINRFGSWCAAMAAAETGRPTTDDGAGRAGARSAWRN
jgi:NAD(P)-dependent dehydrogenase (short-subunit alcohol dehydrogenase family)